jgi:hypothetical protein
VPIDPPNIPALSTKVDPEVKRAISAIKDWFSAKITGKLVTGADLTAALTPISDTLSPLRDTTIPPQLQNFTVTGAFNSIGITWDDPVYARFAYVEIWRSETDDLGTAVKIGTTRSTMYPDTPPDSSLSVTYYYWGRIVSTSGIVGPFNATEGTAGSTANDPAYMMEILSQELEKVTPTPSVPDLVFAVNRFGLKMGTGTGDSAVYPFIVAEIPGAPGTYGVFMDAAFIKAATIKSAQIESLAADKLTVPGTASIWDAIISLGKITNAYIGDAILSNNFATGVSGWYINKDGTAEFRNILARGDIEATSIKAGSANIIDTLMLQGNAVTITDYAAVSSYTAAASNTWYQTGCTITVTQVSGQTYPVLLTAFGRGYIKTSSFAEFKSYIRIRHRESGDVSYQALAAQEFWTGSVYFTVRLTGVVTWKHSPGAGTHHYDLEYYSEGGDILRQITDIAMTCIGAKR